MIPLPRPVRALAILCVVVLFAACANDPSSAATVGETGEISIDQLHGDVALFGFLTGLSGAPCGTPVGNETQDSACARFALANDIREELAKAYAIENDVKVDPADVKDALTQLEQGLGGADALKTQLSDAGVTRAEVEAFAGRLLLVNAVQQAVVEERLDETALHDAYQANLAQFTTLEVAHILVADKADAQRIAAEVTPATFGETAKRESIDQHSAVQGGSLGLVLPGAVPDAVRSGLRRGYPGAEAWRDLGSDPDAVRLARDPPRAARRGAVRGRP